MMARTFRLFVCMRDRRLRLAMVGEVDGSAAAEVCAKLWDLAPSECWLDFSRVQAIDLFAAQVLARGLKELRGEGVRFQVDGLPECVARNLCLGGVLQAVV